MTDQTIVKTGLSWIKRHIELLTIFLGSTFIAIWTLLRFFTTTTTYDLVTQQVLAHSWLHGYTGYISLGPTNYLLKTFLLYMPVDFLPGSPRFKLIILTILINVATFILLFYILKKILSEFKIITGVAYYSAMLWLVIIAGSLFWIGFANSRNLEVAGGMFLVWATLRVLRQPTRSNTIGLTTFATLLFFADSLQLYMVALPLLAYALILALYKKINWQRAAIILAMFGIGFVASFVLNMIAQHFLRFNISSVATNVLAINVSDIARSCVAAAKATIRQFAGGADVGRLREIVNLLFLAAGFITFIVGVMRRKIPLRFAVLIGIFFVVDELVYITSGAALQVDTSRYLIMLGPIVALALGSLGYLYRLSNMPYIVSTVVILVNGLLLGQALLKNWDTNFPKDNHLTSVARYLNSHAYVYAYGSMDTSTPLAYYGGISQTSLFPVACANSKLVHADAFRSTQIIETNSNYSGLTPVILDHSLIANAPNACNKQAIIAQFGDPSAIDSINDGSVVLLFKASQVTRLR